LFDIEYTFKASFDKANRSSIQGKRGRGMRDTLDDFVILKENLGVNTLTDFHSVFEIESFKGVQDWYNTIDVIQIPAFLCRQTDLIQAACRTDKIVNIKKGQFMAPWDMKGVLSKTKGAEEVWITERGTSFGYNTLVTDFTGIQYMRDNFSVPVVFDVTHSVQKPGGQGDSSGGNRDYVPALANAAAGMGVDNFFLEVHPDPDNAPSDGPNMLRLEDFAETVRQLYHINQTIKGF
jgi:2-dehydro-3-deoxyphosphooctonate aldolase (KDO 8-P synthase)